MGLENENFMGLENENFMGLENEKPTECEDCGRQRQPDCLDQGLCPECMRLLELDLPF